MKQFRVVATDESGRRRRYQFADRKLAVKFVRRQRSRRLPAELKKELIMVCFHCKIDGETGEIVQEWTSARDYSTRHEPSVHLFHHGKYNAFGASPNSPVEARERARLAFQNIPRLMVA